MKQKLPKSVYIPEFRTQAVKLVLGQGLTIAAASQQSMAVSMIGLKIEALND